MIVNSYILFLGFEEGIIQAKLGHLRIIFSTVLEDIKMVNKKVMNWERG